MNTLPSFWISHPGSHLHRMDEGHPECPERLIAIEERLRVTGLDRFLQRRDAPAAPVEALLRVREADHGVAVLRTRPGEGLVRLDLDPPLLARDGGAHDADRLRPRTRDGCGARE